MWNSLKWKRRRILKCKEKIIRSAQLVKQKELPKTKQKMNEGFKKKQLYPILYLLSSLYPRDFPKTKKKKKIFKKIVNE